jgi:thiol-disulfide isomerase/thioredoxin
MGNSMKKKIIIIFCFLIAFNFYANSQTIQKVKISDVKKMIDTSQSPLIVNFWASWCKPCVEEIPWFEKIVSENKNSGIKLLLVSLDFEDDYPKALTNFVKKKEYKSEVVWLNETDANYFCNVINKKWEGNIPASVFVNNKKQFYEFIGNQVPEPKLKQVIQKLIE